MIPTMFAFLFAANAFLAFALPREKWALKTLNAFAAVVALAAYLSATGVLA